MVEKPNRYIDLPKSVDTAYVPYSPYPFITRDISLWTEDSVPIERIKTVLETYGGDLLVKTTLFDEYHKEGRVSYAFRLVFQSMVRTLTDTEINGFMNDIYSAVKAEHWEVR